MVGGDAVALTVPEVQLRVCWFGPSPQRLFGGRIALGVMAHAVRVSGRRLRGDLMMEVPR